MENKKIIVVAGATGQQGSSVVDALLADGKYIVRGLTRDPNSSRSQALAQRGVEVVKADQHNQNEIEKALEGAYGFFAVTNFWDPASMGKEQELGKSLVDSAKKQNIQHFLWSSLPDVEKISNGKWNVPHFTDKGKVEEYARQSGLQNTFIGPAFYYQNFASFFPPKKDDQGKYVFTLPSGPDNYITAFDVSDIGPAVVTALNNPQEWKNKFIALAGDHLHPQDYVRIFSEVTGKEAVLNSVTVEQFAQFGFPGADELAQMFGWFNEYTYFGPDADLESGKKANPNIKSWKQWLQSSGWTGES